MAPKLIALKLVCITSKEIMKAYKGSNGKFGAQCGHAFLHTYWDAEERFPERAKAYRESGAAKKVVLVTETSADMLSFIQPYSAKFGYTVVRDAGLTVFKEPTITCIGIGPISEEECGIALNDLKAL